MVGDHTKIGDKCSIKKSIVGSNCVLGVGVKLTNSILMDNVSVQDNVKLDNVIVCSKAYIGEKAFLKDCEVGYGYSVGRECKRLFYILDVGKGEMLTSNYSSSESEPGDGSSESSDDTNLHIRF